MHWVWTFRPRKNTPQFGRDKTCYKASSTTLELGWHLDWTQVTKPKTGTEREQGHRRPVSDVGESTEKTQNGNGGMSLEITQPTQRERTDQ